jgi:3-methylcrotonyl-CoA carboxylase alpha subunit
MFKKILIANRGEIACRVAPPRAAWACAPSRSIPSADARARHVLACDEAVRLAARRRATATCSGRRIIDAARATGAQAIHPGYGFLSENEDFAAPAPRPASSSSARRRRPSPRWAARAPRRR